MTGPFARLDLFDVAEILLKDRVARGNENRGRLFVHKRNHSVLELARSDIPKRRCS